MDFSHKVYAVCRKIPKGRVSTYKEIGKALGIKGCRAVGNALNRNPYCARGRVGGKGCRRQRCLVPCHRVVKSDGSIGGFAAGVRKKIAMLKKEGVDVKNGKIIDFEKVFFTLV